MNIKNKKPLFFIICILILIQAVLALDNNLYVKAKYSKKEVCPCTTLTYKFDIKNIGSYSEIYTLDIDKKFRKWVTFSDNNILLNPGKKTTVYAYLTPDCGLYGPHKLNFFVRTTSTELKAKIPVQLNIKPCYDYEVSLKEVIYYNYTIDEIKDHTGPYNICENEIKTIPIAISNNADFTNIYKLKLKAPKWAYLDYNKLQLPSKKKAIVNIVLMPPLGLEDKFTFSLDVISEIGKIKQSNMFNVEVDKCYFPDIEPKDFLVNYSKLFNDLNIINTGSKKASYLLALDAEPWIAIEPNSIVVEPGKSKTVKLHTTPTEETRKGTYQALLVIVVNENNAQYQHLLNIKLTKPGLFAKLFGTLKANIGKFLLYSFLIFLLILVTLIIILLVRKIKKIEKKEIKPVVVEKKIEKKVKKPRKKLPKKIKRRIIFILIGILLAWLIAINLYALKHKLTFEVPKNVTIPEVVKVQPQPALTEFNVTYYEKAKEKIIDTGLSIWDFIKLYYLYLIIAFVLLAIIILLLILIRKKRIKPKVKEAIEKKVVEKKEIEKPKIEKKPKKKLPKKQKRKFIFGVIGLILALLLLIIAINLYKDKLTFEVPKNVTIPEVVKVQPQPALTEFNVTYYEKAKEKIIDTGLSIWDFIKLYYLYLIIAFVLLAIIIVLLFLIRKKRIKPKVKEAIEKKEIEKPKLKKKKRKKIPKKTLKRWLKVSVVLVIFFIFALYVTLNYEEIGIQKAEKNFVVDFLNKTKQLMGNSLNINITKFIKPEEIPGVVFEGGIPPQKWQINTIHTLDLSKYFSDPDKDPLKYSSTQPENIAVEIEDNIATFSPEYNWTGINTAIFTADDGKGGVMTSNNVYLVVQEEVTEPTININEYKRKIINIFTDIKDYITFYLNYIITGLVILVILILIISYNKRLLKFLEEEKPKKKRKK